MSGCLQVRTLVVHLLALLTIGGDAAAQRRNPSLDFRIPYHAEPLNTIPDALWTDGTTMLVSDNRGILVAVDLATGKRDPAKEALISARGIWSDGATLWASGFRGIRAYNMSTWARDPAKDITDDGMVAGYIWSDGTTMWLTAETSQQGNSVGVLYAYDLDSGARRSAQDIALPHGSARGLWSDGTTIWVLHSGIRNLAQAYNLATGAREAGRDWDLGPTVVSWLDSPRQGPLENVGGVWGLASDGITFWVGTRWGGRLYAFSVATQVRQPGEDVVYLPPSVAKVDVMWSDGTTMWMSNGHVWEAFDMSTRTYDHQKRRWDRFGGADVWSDGATMLLAPGLFHACFYLPGDPRFRSPVYSYDLTARALDLTRRFEPLLTADGRCSAGSDIASDGTTVSVVSQELLH